MELQRKSHETHIIEAGARMLRVKAYGTGVDRDGETVLPTAWQLDRWLANPVVAFGHDYHSLPVARGVSADVNDEGLSELWKFPTEEEAGAHFAFTDSIYRMAKSGFLRGVSVGFIPLEWEDRKGDGRTTPRRAFTRVELLETSIVPIGSDPTALVAGFTSGAIKESDIPVIKGILRDYTAGADGLKAAEWASKVDEILEKLMGCAAADPMPVTPAPPDPRLDDIVKGISELATRMRKLEARIGSKLPQSDLRTARFLIDRLIAQSGDMATPLPVAATPAPGEDAEAVAVRLLRSLRTQKGQ